jgi:anti-anti-sigma regulatory factor
LPWVGEHRAVSARTASVVVTEGESPLVVAISGRFDAFAEAELEDVMAQVRRLPRDVVFDVAAVYELDVEGVLVLADHARGLRRRSCTVVLRGASRSSQQLVRLLGYDRALGLA